MSIAGRTTLINSSLSNAIIYHMSIYLLPKTTIDELDKQTRMFFWLGGSKKRNTYWLSGKSSVKVKEKGAGN